MRRAPLRFIRLPGKDRLVYLELHPSQTLFRAKGPHGALGWHSRSALRALILAEERKNELQPV